MESDDADEKEGGGYGQIFFILDAATENMDGGKSRKKEDIESI